MSNQEPYTIEEEDDMSSKELLELFGKKSPRLHPYCLIGQPLSEVRRIMKERFKGRGHVQIMVNGELSYMDMRVSYWYCNVDENNIMTEIWPVFDYK